MSLAHRSFWAPASRLSPLVGAVLSLLLAGALGALSGCGSLGDHRQNIGAQDDADAQAKTQELQVAAGVYTGQVTLAQSQQKFDVEIDLEVQPENVHDEDSIDPTEVAKVPVLSGSMHFPALDRLATDDLADFSGLTDPMGQCKRVNIDFGDYNPATGEIILPYTIPNYSTGSYGELSGTFVPGVPGQPGTKALDHFSGEWDSKLGVAGTFDVYKKAGAQ